MQVHISPSMRRITISTTNGFLDPMKIKGVARYLSYRCLFWSILVLAFIFPLLFITTALVTLEGASKCATPYCMGRKFGPTPYWGRNRARRRMEELYSTLLDSDKIPLEGLKIPNNIEELVSDAKANNYDVKAIMLNLKAMVDVHEERARAAKLQEALYRHFASSGIPKGMYCLSLKLTAEYSTNALARQELPSPDLAPRLTDNSYHHLVVATDNVLAASVVVSSAIKNSADPEKVVFHIITDKKTFAAMHAWFSLNPMSPAIVEVKGVHQFSWLTKDHVPVLDAIENSRDIKQYYHGDHAAGADMNVSSSALASKLQARSPKYISIMNHLRIYLPELFPALNKVVFLDDDVVVQRDLSPLWDIDLHGKVNGAVETCKGEDKWVMSKTFKNYFNFSHPMVNQRFDADRCAWAYGMNVFDLQAWRLTDITTVYHFWQKQNLRQNLTLWRLGTLPPALIAFDGYVHPIDSSWHMLGLGYHPKSNVTHVQQSAVIHYNGQAKPWLDIAFPELRHFWTKYVDYSNEFIRQCNILES